MSIPALTSGLTALLCAPTTGVDPRGPAQAPAIPRSHTGVSQPLSLFQQREVLGLPPAAHTLGREIKMRFTHTLQRDCREQCPLANGK